MASFDQSQVKYYEEDNVPAVLYSCISLKSFDLQRLFWETLQRQSTLAYRMSPKIKSTLNIFYNYPFKDFVPSETNPTVRLITPHCDV